MIRVLEDSNNSKNEIKEIAIAFLEGSPYGDSQDFYITLSESLYDLENMDEIIDKIEKSLGDGNIVMFASDPFALNDEDLFYEITEDMDTAVEYEDVYNALQNPSFYGTSSKKVLIDSNSEGDISIIKTPMGDIFHDTDGEYSWMAMNIKTRDKIISQLQ